MRETVVTQEGPPPGDQAPVRAPSATVEAADGAQDVDSAQDADKAQDGRGDVQEDGAAADATVPGTNGAPVGDSVPARTSKPWTTVMLLGAGEPARELAISFQRLGAEVIVVDHRDDGPAYGVADRGVVMPMEQPERLFELIEAERPHCVVPLTESVAVDALETIAEERVAQVIPTAKAVRLAGDREGMRCLAAEELGLPTPAYWFASSLEELRKVLEVCGFPAVVRPSAAAYGQAESVVLRHDDAEPAWELAVASNFGGSKRVMVETAVEIDYEITLLTVRTAGVGGATRLYFCEPIAHRRSATDALQAWQPQPLSQPAMELARSIAARVVNALGGHGVYGVELFVRGNEVYFCDVSARPYDSGLVTACSQRLSEFDMHARAVLGLSIDTLLISPAAAEVVYGDSAGPSAVQIGEALHVPESDLRMFGHAEAHRRRRVGVALATAPDASTALQRAHTAAKFLR